MQVQETGRATGVLKCNKLFTEFEWIKTNKKIKVVPEILLFWKLHFNLGPEINSKYLYTAQLKWQFQRHSPEDF